MEKGNDLYSLPDNSFNELMKPLGQTSNDILFVEEDYCGPDIETIKKLRNVILS